MSLTDIHMHVIPCVDDGARSMDEALDMIRLAVSQGVDTIFATPHSSAFDDYEVPLSFSYGKSADIVKAQFEALRERVRDEGIPVRILLGCEVNCEDSDIRQIVDLLDTGIYPTMNGTKYVLAEFWQPQEVDAFYRVERLLEARYTPIIAHAERYHFINTDTAAALRKMGARIQINYYSLGEEKKASTSEKARSLLAARLVDFLGSDAHQLDHRPPAIRQGAEYVRKTCEAEYAEKVLRGNAKQKLVE